MKTLNGGVCSSACLAQGGKLASLKLLDGCPTCESSWLRAALDPIRYGMQEC
jgi:hypothetical protein